jgi:hypothetical protein
MERFRHVRFGSPRRDWDGMAPAFRDRRIMGTRFRCTTILPHAVACAGSPSIYIRKRGRGRWTMADHSHAIRARQAVAPIDAKPGTFASIVKRCEVAFLYDRGCVPSYTVDMIEFDEPPWNRFLDKPWGRFICPGCGQPLEMHVSYGPGTPGTERFDEVAQVAHGPSAPSTAGDPSREAR